jgi:hypothetical protein
MEEREALHNSTNPTTLYIQEVAASCSNNFIDFFRFIEDITRNQTR